MALDVQVVLDVLSRWGYLLVFLTVLGEGFPLLGAFIPGNIVVVIAAAAAAAGALDVRLLILVAIPAAILGDVPGFFVGRRYGRGFLQRVVERFPVAEKPIAKTTALFDRRGALALIACRFSNVTRAVGSTMAGVSRMGTPTFLLFNVIGAVAWAVITVLFGYFFGLGFLAVQARVGQAFGWSLLVGVALYALYRALRKLAPQLTRDDFLVTLLGIAAGLGFGLLVDQVAARGPDNPIDRAQPALAVLVAPLGPALEVAGWLASFGVLVPLALVLTFVLAMRRRVWEAALAALSVGGALLLAGAAREAMGASPDLHDLPSAHAAVAIASAGALVFIAAATATRAWPMWLAIAGGATFCALASLAFIVGRGEQPTDVLGGLLLGVAWLSVTILLTEFGIKREAAR